MFLPWALLRLLLSLQATADPQLKSKDLCQVLHQQVLFMEIDPLIPDHIISVFPSSLYNLSM